MSWDLVADIGGTNARFARLEGGVIGDVRIYPSADMPILDAVQDFVSLQTGVPNTVLSAAAGPVFDGRIHLTNIDQVIDVDGLKKAASAEQSIVINDFEAAAWAMATVASKDVRTLRGDALSEGHRLVLGPGTGLGVGTLLRLRASFHALPGEGGHVILAAKTEQDWEIFNEVLNLWPEVRTVSSEQAMEAEAILSGRGLPILYAACRQVLGHPKADITIAEIMAGAKEGTDLAASLMANVFRRYLGQVAGDLAITQRAAGGIFLVGGVSTKNPWLYDQTFLDAIDAGGRFREMRARYAVHLYLRDDFGLVGAANALTYGDWNGED